MPPIVHRRTPRLLIFAATLATTGALGTSVASASPPIALGPRIHVSGSGGEGAFPVGFQVQSLVDSSRSTPANGTVSGHPGRSLETVVFYPASGRPPTAGVGGASVTSGAQPARSAGPFPLIVFAHGFGTDPSLSEYNSLLEQWAAAGFVVAAPLFPLTRGDAPGQPDLSDFANQPGDMSFVAGQLLQQSARRSGLLAGLINPTELGAAGHSLGGVTTLGLVANSCCQDRRFKAAVVMSGDPITFPTGAVNYGHAPPILLVHGNADPAVPYVSSILAFNGASGPKGLLTLIGGNHDSPVNARGRGFPSVVRATIDFFDRFLKGQTGALSRLVGTRSRPAGDAIGRVTTLVFVPRPRAQTKLPVPKTVTRTLQATVAPTTNLSDGQTVTVSWSNYQPGTSINILECAVPHPSQASDCDLQTATLLHPDPAGAGSLPFVVHRGVIGSGTCDAAHPQCVVVVNQGGSLEPAATVSTPISFNS